MMKPYRQMPIAESQEPLVAIPLERFAIEVPHAYIKCGADYGGKSPYYLRQGVLERLILAAEYLHQLHPGWKILIFDAYRPVEVQQYMVDYTFSQTIADRGLDPEQLTDAEREAIWQAVYRIWAIPSFDLATPPPHSTGAACDVTLIDDRGVEIDMGSPIDEMSDRSSPDYFIDMPIYHNRRQLLLQIMTHAGFLRHPAEWWHFSVGDQLWAWLKNQQQPEDPVIAYYGKS
jgi:zinc D-Ala-D-Ala dipeptidase